MSIHFQTASILLVSYSSLPFLYSLCSIALDGEHIQVGTHTMVALFTPGHTKGQFALNAHAHTHKHACMCILVVRMYLCTCGQ